jgi:peptide/nickel transport system substrate-binding protein
LQGRPHVLFTTGMAAALRRDRIAALLSALCFLACTSGAPDEDANVAEPEAEVLPAGPPVRGDWLVQWLLADPENLNPLTQNDASASEVLGGIMTTLLGLHPKTLEYFPVVAAAMPEISADHLRYTFHIRSDVTFSDGKPLTAEDVVFSLKAIKNPEVNAPHLRNYYNSIVAADIVDPTTIVFRCKEPYFRNDAMLGGISILPRHFYDPRGDLDAVSVAELEDWERLDPAKKERAVRFAASFNVDFNRKVLGAGAFVLVDPERDLRTGERIVLHRRSDYWAPDDPFRGDAFVNRAFFRIINNQDAALVALKAGTLDLMGLTPLQHTKQTNTPGFRKRFAKQLAYTPSYTYLGWNQRRPVLREKKVRQALARLVDRDRIIDKVLLGFGEKIDSPIYKFLPEYNHEIPGYSFDPATAARMLDEAGWTDSDGDGVRDKIVDGLRIPLAIEIVSNSGNSLRKNVGLIVIDELRRAGIAATFREVDWSIMLDKVSKKFDYDAVILGWAMSVGDTDLFQVWHSSQAIPDGSNHVGFRNAEADGILEEYRRTFDEGKRIRLYRRLQEIIYDEAPYAFLYMPKAISAYDRRFRNTIWYPTGSPNVNEWWVPATEQRYTQ